MTETKFTGGTWFLEEHRGSRHHDEVTGYVLHSDLDDEGHDPDDIIAEIYGPGPCPTIDPAGDEMKANAALIEAAPAMHEALGNGLALLRAFVGPDDEAGMAAIHQMSAALAKARGETS